MKYQSSIDQNAKYKQEKKLEKEKLKREQQYQKKIAQLKAIKEKRLAKYKEELDQKYQRDLEKYTKKQKIQLEKFKRKIEWKKPLKKYEKKDSLQKLKNQVYEAIQKYARLRDSDLTGYWRCISCWKRVHRTQADWWHYISRANMSTAFNTDNINLQCKYCNGMLHWNLVEYRKWLIKKIGIDWVERLEQLKNKTTKRYKGELENLLILYTEINKKLESKKGKLLKSK